MKKFFAVLTLFVLLSCTTAEVKRTYANKEIGLTFKYSTKWVILTQRDIGNAIKEADNTPSVPEGAISAANELKHLILLSLIKPHQSDGKNYNPNIMVMVIKLSENESKATDVNSIIQQQIGEVKSTFQGSKAEVGVYPLKLFPSVSNYVQTLPLTDRLETQFMYAYIKDKYWVQICFGYSHPEDEKEIKEIIDSMQINNG